MRLPLRASANSEYTSVSDFLYLSATRSALSIRAAPVSVTAAISDFDFAMVLLSLAIALKSITILTAKASSIAIITIGRSYFSGISSPDTAAANIKTISSCETIYAPKSFSSWSKRLFFAL